MSKIRPFNFAWVQWLWAASGLTLFMSGVLIINVPDNRLVSIASCLGLAMLFAGFINLVVYFSKKDEIHSSRWLLADGLSTSLLSLFPIFNEMVVPEMIPFFFGVWELFSGILKVIDAKELEEEKIQQWHWFLGIGCIELLSGIASMIEPVDHALGINHVIAVILFVQSCGFLFKILVYPHLINAKEIR